ncbi:hypothetical protein DXG01_001714 [Tephrocybe rancida]|nr:hypothetical protein DXG01_001714 [Tephrocybe rancida]
MNINWRGDAPKGQLRTDCENAVQAAAGSPWNTTGKTFVEATIRRASHIHLRAEPSLTHALYSRGADHEMTTNSQGKRVPDQRHITVNYKDAAQQSGKKHTPAHVYLNGKRPKFDIDNVVFYNQKWDFHVEAEGGDEDKDDDDD